MDEHRLLELCRHAVAVGERMGATAVEAQARSASNVGADIEQGQVSAVNRRASDNIAIRAFIGRRMGSAFTNIATRKAVEEALGLALSSARATTEDKDWVALPEPREYPEIRGLWNEDLAAVEPVKVVEISGELMASAVEGEPGLIPALGGSEVAAYRSAFANSGGIAHAERGSVAFAGLGAIAKTEGGVTPMVFSYEVDRTLELDLDRVVSDLTESIRVCKRTAEGESGKSTVVMHPEAYGEILYYTLQQSVRGDNVARGKSKLEGKVGERIASELVTIVDDGVNPRGAATSISDDEGVPRQRTPVIEGGVLRGFLWDSYWGNRMGEESTGNASRRMRQGLVELSPTNTVVEPGRREIGEIVSEMGSGYLIRGVQGAHSSNPESGDFSVVGNPAMLIEGGELVGAVHGLMFSGNVYELLGQAVEVARTPITIQGLIGPEIVFEDVNVISRG